VNEWKINAAGLRMVMPVFFFFFFIAAGLFYLAELVEEYTITSAKIIRSMLWVSCVPLPSFGIRITVVGQ
jgi:hypothetical protein